MGIAGNIYEGGGAKPVSFPNKGDSIEGRVVNIKEKQLTKFGSERLETWDNGDPKMTPILTLATELREDEEDEGLRDVYLRGGLFSAFGEALRKAFPARPDDSELIGCRLKVQFYKTEPSRYGTPRKLYRAEITRAAGSSAASAYDAKNDDNDDIPF